MNWKQPEKYLLWHESSNLRFLCYQLRQNGTQCTLRAGFEPARGDPIGFRVQRLNHSAIAAVIKCVGRMSF